MYGSPGICGANRAEDGRTVSPQAFLVLLAVTAIAFLGAVGVVAVQPRLSATSTVTGDPMFNSLTQRIADLQKVAVQTARYKATWAKRDGKWVATDHADYPAKDGAVAIVVNALAAMTKVEPKTDNPDWYQYIQVAEPTGKADAVQGIRITASAANGDVLVDTIVGSMSSTIAASHSRGGTFVRNMGQSQSWLVEGTVAIPDGLTDWFDPIVSIPGPNVTGVAVLIGDKVVFEAHKVDPTTGQYKIVHLDASVGSSDDVANDDAIHGLAAGIVNVTAQDARSLDSITPGKSARIDRFTTNDGMQLDVTLVDADGATWAIFKASAPDGTDGAKAAAKVNGLADRWAFKLDSGPIAGLTTDVSELVHPPGTESAPDRGGAFPGGAGAPFVFPRGQQPPGFGQGGTPLPLPPGFGQGGPPLPGPAPLIR
jgi:hypothetical protein